MSTNKEKGKTIISKYRLQSIVREICPDTRTAAICMRKQIQSKTCVHKNDAEKRARYSGLMACGSRWVCPVCSIKKNARDANDIRALIDHVDCDMYLITYTIQHTKDDRLKKLLDDLNKAIAYMKNGEKKKRFDARFHPIGNIRALEIRWSERSGFHPHIHELLLCKSQAIDEKNNIMASLMGDGSYVGWLKKRGYLTNSFTVDVRSSCDTGKGKTLGDYLTKCGIELELSLGENKQSEWSLSPFQLLDAFSKTGEVIYRDAFRELRLDTTRRQQVRWSKGLRGLLPEVDGTQETENPDQWRLLAMLDSEQWKIIERKGLRGTLLVKARDCEHDADFVLWLSHAIYGQVERVENNSLAFLVA